MRLLFLRGKVDKRTQKVTKIEDHWDMWTQLAYHMTGSNDTCRIALWGGHRRINYTDYIQEEWVEDFKYWNTNYEPDVIFARGGFPQYIHILKQFPEAFKIYYGAGTRTHPDDGIKYDIVLIDDLNDMLANTFYKQWAKPAAEQFYPRDTGKDFDICYIANKQQSEIKRIAWVYRTVPKDLKMLHLGYIPSFPAPSNVTRMRVDRQHMPWYISRCQVGICPYKSYDSGPRALSEMIACGLPVVTLTDTRHYDFDMTIRADKKHFWEIVRKLNGYIIQRKI